MVNSPWLLIHGLFNKRTVPYRWKKTHATVRRTYFTDGKHGMENFNTTDLRRFSWLEKPYMDKKNTVKSHSKRFS